MVWGRTRCLAIQWPQFRSAARNWAAPPPAHTHVSAPCRPGREARGSGIGGRGGGFRSPGESHGARVGCGGSPAHAVARRAAPPHPHCQHPLRTAPYVRCGAIHMQFTCQAAGITRTLQSAAEFAAEAVPARARATARAAGMAKRDMMVCCVVAPRCASRQPSRERQLKLRICFGDARSNMRAFAAYADHLNTNHPQIHSNVE